MSPYQTLLKEVYETCEKTHRDIQSVQIIVASKYFSVDQMRSLYEEGVRDFGENRVQDALEKIPQLPQDIRWHFFGHLQTNKINKIKGLFSLIHSIDSLKVAQKLDQISHKQAVLIQIKTSDEPTKTGFTEKEFIEVLPKLKALKNLEIKGLMTVAPKGDLQTSKKAFERLLALKNQYGEPTWGLSMGMSQDFEEAINCQATWIRVGRRLL